MIRPHVCESHNTKSIKLRTKETKNPISPYPHNHAELYVIPDNILDDVSDLYMCYIRHILQASLLHLLAVKYTVQL